MRQVFEAWHHVHQDLQHRFAGSVRWVTRRGHDYLHRKIGERERSLGRRSPETEQAIAAFLSGRTEAKDRASRLAARLDELAPVNRALRLGRVPRVFARILRRLDEQGLLGTHLLVVGTHALFAFEAAAGVQLRSGLLATSDGDLLWDARQRLSLLLPEARREGVLALLQRVDHSFQMRAPGDFRAFNSDGFWVDLIRPEDRTFFATSARATVGENAADLRPSPIHGLEWWLNVPRWEAVVVGEDGYPVRMATIDPRAFALHKLWLAQQPQRDPVKAARDRAQAQVAWRLASTFLGLKLAGDELRGLPASMRALAPDLEAAPPSNPEVETTPRW